MYELFVKQKIEAGLKAVDEHRTVPREEMKRLLDAKNRTRPGPLVSAFGLPDLKHQAN